MWQDKVQKSKNVADIVADDGTHKPTYPTLPTIPSNSLWTMGPSKMYQQKTQRSVRTHSYVETHVKHMHAVTPRSQFERT